MKLYDFIFSIIKGENTEYENLDEESIKEFSPFMINRILSFDSQNTATANEINKYLQFIPEDNLLKIFNILFANSGRVNVSYNRNSVVKFDPNVVDAVKNYFEITPKEAHLYLETLENKQVKKILFESGWTNKYINKL